MFDAYTVKKVLPRLVIAAILIQLSWPIFTTMIQVTNQIAWGVEGIMYAPWGGRDAVSIGKAVAKVANNSSTAPAVVVGGGAVAAAVYGVGLGPAGIITLFITVLLALLIVFVVLAIRQAVLIGLLVLAPIALVAWILPGTEKFWKLWWESFSKLLLMYPLILLLLASGRIFAFVTAEGFSATKDNPETFGVAIVILIFFAPFFLIPKTFQLAGSAFANIAGIANNRSRGAFDRLRNFRGQRVAQRGAAARSGELFNNDRLNALTSRATTRNLGFGRRGRSAYQQKMALAAMEHAKSGQGQAAQFNDSLLRAQTYGSAQEARENMGRDFGMSEAQVTNAIAAARANGGFGRARQVYAAQQLAATGTGYDDLAQVRDTIARVSGGNEDTIAALAGNINSTTKTAGRYDLAPGFGNLNNLARARAGLAPAPAGAPAAAGPPDPEIVRTTVAAARGADAVTLLRGKPAEVENLTNALGFHLEQQMQVANDATATDAQRAAATNEALQTTAQIEQLSQAKGYASTQNQEHVNNLLRQTEVLRTGLSTPGSAGPVDPRSVTGHIIADGDVAAEWARLSPPPRNPNDPNLPT